jgi:hypothetical protein
MPDQVALSQDDPRMVAWTAYQQTEDYANSRRWALHAEADAREYVDGSLWAAFLAGWQARETRVRGLPMPDLDAAE